MKRKSKKEYTKAGVFSGTFFGAITIQTVFGDFSSVLSTAITRRKIRGGGILPTFKGVVSVLLGFSGAVAGFAGRLAGAVVGFIGRLSGAVVGFVGRLFVLSGRLVGCLAGYGIYKILKKNYNNKGYTLIEILIALGILSITSGIAYVSYQGYTSSVSKKDLYTHGRLFANSVKNCINASGGWEITLLQSNGLPGATDKLCDTGQNTNSGKTATELLKSKLDFTCPPDADCNTFTRNSNRTKLRYTCLSIEKEVSGKKLQVISRVSFDNPSTYEIWCNEVADYLIFSHMRCRRGADLHMKHPPQSDNPTSELIKGCPKDWK